MYDTVTEVIVLDIPKGVTVAESAENMVNYFTSKAPCVLSVRVLSASVAFAARTYRDYGWRNTQQMSCRET